MIPTLFPADYVDKLSYSGDFPTFPMHGDVDLIDCLECMAEQTEDEESEWELAFVYPVNGIGFDQLALDKIVVEKVNSYQDPQAFRIYAIEKRINKTVAVKCQHISYDMVNVPVKTFKLDENTDNKNPERAVNNLYQNTIYGSNWKKHHFKVTTDIKAKTKFELADPKSMRAVLLDGDDSIKGTYGGDLVFDNYSVQLKQTAGEDRDVVINYGIDLIDMTQEENNSEMITGILPYYKRSTNDDKYETEPIMYGALTYGPGEYTVQKIEAVDLSAFFPDDPPTVAQLNAKAKEWVKEEEIGEPEISLTVSYATLGQDVRMHDAIRICFPSMGIDKKAKVVKYKYDCLLERCVEVEVGHAKDSKLFSLMDASKLRKGLIPPDRVGNESITNNKIAKGGVGKGKIGEQAIGKSNIELGAIDHELLSKKGSPSGAAVRSDTMEDGSVSSNILADAAVVGAKLAAESVTAAKIALQAITSTKIATDAVTTRAIVDEAVANAKLDSDLQASVASISTLAANVAYIQRVFANNVQVSYMNASQISASTFIYNSYTVYRAKVQSADDPHTGYYVLATNSFVM